MYFNLGENNTEAKIEDYEMNITEMYDGDTTKQQVVPIQHQHAHGSTLWARRMEAG